MAQTNWEADKMLDVYIYDYLLKRNLQASAQAFQAEGKVSSEPVAIDAPGGFLFEWWSVFWDIFIARTNEKHSDVAAAYIETQQLKAREQHQQQQQQLHLHQQQQHQQQQLQLQLLRQQQQQQQQQQPPRRDGNNMTLNNGANGLGSDSLVRQSSANVMASKIYEECLKQPQKREIEEATLKRFVDNPGQIIEASQTSLLKSSSTPGQPGGQMLHPATLQQAQVRSQPLSGVSQQENKNDVSGVLNQRSPATDPSLFGVSGVGQSKPNLLSPGVNSGVNSLPLKGWPLTGLDQLRPNMLPSKSFVQSPQQFHQMQMLNPQQQQQLLLQAQQAQGNLGSAGSPLLGDFESRRFKMLLGRNTVLNKDGAAAIGDVMQQGMGSPVQAASQIPRNNDELLMKLKLAQFQQQQQQQPPLSVNQGQQASQQMQGSQQPPPATPQQQHQDKLVGVVGTIDASKGQSGRKRKQAASSSGPANSTGTGNTIGPSSAPSTPSTHTPGDVIPMGGALQHNLGASKASILYGSDGTGTLTASSNQLAEMERFAEDGSLDDNVESFLSYEEADQREPLFSCSKRSPGHTMDTSKVDANKGFSFTEFRCLKASNSKVVACHFSSDGKLLASAGHDKKAVLWSMDNFKLKSTLEEHNFLVTDVRFSSNPTRLATSSFDKTVKVWDAENPSYSLRSFLGHRGSVMSLDFHPTNEDLLCSCDGENEIRYWSVNQGICTRTFQGGMSQVRFQPRVGRLLAAAAENVVSLFDVESEVRVHSLQRHTKPVHSVCWDANGDYLASVSEDSVRVWAVGPGGDGQCMHELSCNGNKFHSCVFHPTYPQILVIGCYQSLELWSMQENKSMTVPAHDGLIEALTQSPVAGMVASASHDKCVKLWK